MIFSTKELSFQVSCSYGPGRYDPTYEQQGHDYPIAFVRWTEKRNFQAVLDALAAGHLSTELLISHRFSIDEAPSAYSLLSASESSLGLLIQYPDTAEAFQKTIPLIDCQDISPHTDSTAACLDVIGTGNYASRVLIPAFAKAGAQFNMLASNGGSGPVHIGKRYSFVSASTDVPSLFSNSRSNAIVIATSRYSLFTY